MNILKGIGIICGATAILVMGIWSADYIMILNDVYEARHGDEKAKLLLEKRFEFLDGIMERKNAKEVLILAKEYIKNNV